MDNLDLDKDKNFIVQESVLINSISGFIFLALFFGILVTRNFEINNATGSFYLIYLLLLVGALGSFVNAKKRKILMTINKNGIYYKETFITDWKNFTNAYISQEEYKVSTYSDGLNDKFNITVIYFEPNAGANYMYQINMSNSQNKSEYQIISAMQYFSGKELSLSIF